MLFQYVPSVFHRYPTMFHLSIYRDRERKRDSTIFHHDTPLDVSSYSLDTQRYSIDLLRSSLVFHTIP